MVPAVTERGCWVVAMVVVRKYVSYFVGDEAMAGQGGGGGEAGAALQTLQGGASCPPAAVLHDVLQEGCLVLSGEATGGAAEARYRGG